MSTFTVEIKCDNAAMTVDEEGLVPDGQAIADILCDIENQVAAGVTIGAHAIIRDINGNTIGKWEITEHS